MNDIKSFFEKMSKIENKEILNKNEFKLMKDNINYNIILTKTNDSIIVECSSYIKIFKFGKLSNLIKHNLNSLEDEFNFLYNLFINKNIEIKDILKDTCIILILKLDKNNNNNNNQQINICIYLIKDKLNKDYIINELYNKNIKLEKEIKQLKNNILEMEKLTNKTENKNNFSDSINLVPIIKTSSYTRNPKDNTFIIFNSKDSILYLIFGTEKRSIISYNVNDNKKMIEIKKAHDDDIIEFNYCYDKTNNREIIMSLSPLNFLKIWDLKNWECILVLTKINKIGLLSCSCFLNIKDDIYIVTSNSNYGVGTEKIKIYNLKGEIVKQINNSNESTLFTSTYYDEGLSATYIIASNKDYIKAYDYDNNKLYHKYYEKNNGHHFTVIVNKIEGLVRLIEPCSSDGFIRIWNFHHGNLLCKISTNEKICSLCLWNNKYLFSGTIDGKIILIDLINQVVVKTIDKAHKNWVNCIKKFKNNKYGECLVTQGFDEQIQIYSNKI